MEEESGDSWRELDVVGISHAELERNQRVAESHGQAELVGDLRIETRLVVVEVALLERQQVVESGDLLANNDGQVLGEDEMLILGDDDAASLLEDGLVVPFGVELRELARHTVVLAEPDRVHGLEESVVFGARIARLVELAGAHARCLALLPVGTQREEFTRRGLDVREAEETALEQTQLGESARVRAVGLRQVGPVGHQVELFARAEVAVEVAERGARTNERDARLIAVVVVLVRNWNVKAVWVLIKIKINYIILIKII